MMLLPNAALAFASLRGSGLPPSLSRQGVSWSHRRGLVSQRTAAAQGEVVEEDTESLLWPGWSESVNASAELLYMPFLEHQLGVVLDELEATPAPLAAELAYAWNAEKGARLGSRLFRVDGLFRRVRMSYFDGGASIQVFNSLWYPSPDRVDAPLLGIDLLCFGRKLLCVVDAQPAAGRDVDSVPHDATGLAAIHARYASLQGTPSGRWYEDNRYFSPQMLYGTFPEDGTKAVKADLFPAFRDYLREYLRVVRACPVDPAYPGIQHQTAYDFFNAQRDPASKLFKSYFGQHFADHFVHDFLFALDTSLDDRIEEDAAANDEDAIESSES